MKVTVTKHIHGNSKIAIVDSREPLMTDTQSALDLMTEVKAVYGCDKMIVAKEDLPEEFFDLSSRLAGEVLQKYTNYQMKLAVVGDFSEGHTKSLLDFIGESNSGAQFFFLPSEELAVTKLHGVS